MSGQSIMSTSKLKLTGSQQLFRCMVRTEVVPFIRGRLSGRVCFQIYEIIIKKTVKTDN